MLLKTPRRPKTDQTDPPPPLDLPAVLLLSLEQRNCPWEEHTWDFVNLAFQTRYPELSFNIPAFASGPKHASQWIVHRKISPHLWSGCWYVMDWRVDGDGVSEPGTREKPEPPRVSDQVVCHSRWAAHGVQGHGVEPCPHHPSQGNAGSSLCGHSWHG